MHLPKSSYEIDLIEWILGQLSILRKKWPLILFLTLLGLILGIYLIITGKAPGKSFYRQSYFLVSPVDDKYLVDICNSVAAQISNDKGSRPEGLRNIETRLSPTVLKESRIKIEFSAYDTHVLSRTFLLFEDMLINHAGYKLLLKSNIEKNKFYLDDLEKQLSRTCHGDSIPVAYCMELLVRRSQLRQTLNHSMSVEYIVIDEQPVLVSQRRERNLLLAGMSLTGFAAGVIMVILSRYFFVPVKNKN